MMKPKLITSTKVEKDIDDTEQVLLAFANDPELTNKPITIVMMRSLVYFWAQLQQVSCPFGNWQVTYNDLNALSDNPRDVSNLLNGMQARAMSTH